VRQQIKYGLLAPLRSFDVPERWQESEAALSNEFEQVSANHYIVPAGTSGNLTIRQGSDLTIEIQADCDVTISDVIMGYDPQKRIVRLLVRPGAVVRYHVLQDAAGKVAAMLDYQAEVENATLHWLFVGVGGENTAARIRTFAGTQSTTSCTSVIVGTGKQQFDVHAHTIHTGPGSTSNMLTRCIVDNEARVISHGLIRVESGAHDCDSYQKNETILLGTKAAADAIPNLEIHDHRVRCTHGATIGKLDEEKLFYFRSRGIPTAEAKRLITEGFLLPLLPPQWHQKISEKISHS
jgi:Fe-S cluster assembly protein SufD